MCWYIPNELPAGMELVEYERMRWRLLRALLPLPALLLSVDGEEIDAALRFVGSPWRKGAPTSVPDEAPLATIERALLCNDGDSCAPGGVAFSLSAVLFVSPSSFTVKDDCSVSVCPPSNSRVCLRSPVDVDALPFLKTKSRSRDDRRRVTTHTVGRALAPSSLLLLLECCLCSTERTLIVLPIAL